jgi:hypothetical protein
LYGHDYDSALEAIGKMESDLPGFFYAGKSITAPYCYFVIVSHENVCYSMPFWSAENDALIEESVHRISLNSLVEVSRANQK